MRAHSVKVSAYRSPENAQIQLCMSSLFCCAIFIQVVFYEDVNFSDCGAKRLTDERR